MKKFIRDTFLSPVFWLAGVIGGFLSFSGSACLSGTTVAFWGPVCGFAPFFLVSLLSTFIIGIPSSAISSVVAIVIVPLLGTFLPNPILWKVTLFIQIMSMIVVPGVIARGIAVWFEKKKKRHSSTNPIS